MADNIWCKREDEITATSTFLQFHIDCSVFVICTLYSISTHLGCFGRLWLFDF